MKILKPFVQKEITSTEKALEDLAEYMSSQADDFKKKGIDKDDIDSKISDSFKAKSGSLFSITEEYFPFSFYKLTGVSHFNHFYDVRISDGALENKAPIGETNYFQKTFLDWEKHVESARNHNFIPASAPFYYSIFHTLWKNKDGDYEKVIEEFRKSLKRTFEETEIVTRSRTHFSNISPRNDELLNHIDKISESEVESWIGKEIRGSDLRLYPLKDSEIIIARSFSQNVFYADRSSSDYSDYEENILGEVFHWITEKPVFVYRHSYMASKEDRNKPIIISFKNDERIFFRNGPVTNTFCIDLKRPVDESKKYSCLGVIITQQKDEKAD